MSRPTPLQSFLGGVGLVAPVQFLLVLNGSVFGISGFLHNTVRGGKEALASVAGFLLGGAIIGAVEGVGPKTVPTGFFQIVYSGLLVGIGTKVRAFLLLSKRLQFHTRGSTDVLWLYLRVSKEYPRVRQTSFLLGRPQTHALRSVSLLATVRTFEMSLQRYIEL